MKKSKYDLLENNNKHDFFLTVYYRRYTKKYPDIDFSFFHFAKNMLINFKNL